MDKKLKFVLALLGTIGFLFIDFSFSLGWLVGCIALFALNYVRERYYSIVLTENPFSTRRYIGYIFFVFVILWIAPILAFIFPDVINPFTLIAAYFIDRFILYIGRIFKKESVYVTK